MFYCERCGSSFNATVAATASYCPKCGEESVTSPLRFRLFEPSALRVAGLAPRGKSAQDPARPKAGSAA